ncbi:dihydroorotate dehydrogenase [Acrocarpospora pleiomorpha]|uniref:Dihydroorotate dehydrogenase n=1 Tax=Acrocarpospora pleiomorpha TaxID=90975 RepID=A0A5M3XKB6_9ACTN|nr:ATP-binding protein [Acrocarpospora pleiomorpha]GES21867.1 dihydroorotate dehydrogenase [Acrocarpospora pleiomorpha]
MDARELAELVELVRASGTDLADVEIKAAGGGLSKSVRETISAFANGHGGTLILGLDEREGFLPAAGFDAKRIQESLSAACADEMEPPVRADIRIVVFEGAMLVLAEIPGLGPRFKPCYVKARGEYGGSFIRGGDGDRRLTDFEIHLLHTNRGQPRDDLSTVEGATLDDLDADELAYLLRRLRQRQPRAFAGLDDRAALRRLNVLDGGAADVPTLAGMLTFGRYPQQWFPQLNVTLVVYPGIDSGDTPPGGPRFLDSRAFDGPIPHIVEEAVAGVIRNMAVRAYVEGVGRRDVYDHPVEAIREALVNALVHRDYSPYSHGSPVQITMYVDRMTIANPGGLYGAVTEEDLGREGVTSSRNPALIKLLQDARLPDSDRTVCENRGSGIPAMFRELRQVHAAPPEFRNRISRFTVTFRKGLDLPAQKPFSHGTSAVDSVLAAVPRARFVSRKEVQDASGLPQATVIRQLNRLIEAGLVIAAPAGRSPRRRYRRI